MSTSTTDRKRPAGEAGDADVEGEQSADLVSRVIEDSRLVPAEKETSIGFDKTRDTVTLFTAEAGLMRRALSHPHAEVVSLVERGKEIHGVTVTLPVGCLSVSSAPRSSGGHADVITRRVLDPDGNEGDA